MTGCRSLPRRSSARSTASSAWKLLDVPDNATGVLYALAGFSAGNLALRSGRYPQLRVQSVRDRADQDRRFAPAAHRPRHCRGRVEADRPDRRPDGRHPQGQRRGGGEGRVPRAMSLHFTSNATFDIGADLDSPVSLDYFDEAPFPSTGQSERPVSRIEQVILADDGNSKRDRRSTSGASRTSSRCGCTQYKIMVKIVEPEAQWLDIDMTTVTNVGLAPWLFNLYIDPKEEAPGRPQHRHLARVDGGRDEGPRGYVPTSTPPKNIGLGGEHGPGVRREGCRPASDPNARRACRARLSPSPRPRSRSRRGARRSGPSCRPRG